VNLSIPFKYKIVFDEFVHKETIMGYEYQTALKIKEKLFQLVNGK
jgi:hypothetical protein